MYFYYLFKCDFYGLDVNKWLLVENFSKKKRCEEELELIKKDMESYVKYYTSVSLQLEADISNAQVFPGVEHEEMVRIFITV